MMGGEASLGLSMSNSCCCSEVEMSKSGWASFRSMSERVRDVFPYLLMNRRYTLHAPRKDSNFCWRAREV